MPLGQGRHTAISLSQLKKHTVHCPDCWFSRSTSRPGFATILDPGGLNREPLVRCEPFAEPCLATMPKPFRKPFVGFVGCQKVGLQSRVAKKADGGIILLKMSNSRA